MKAPAFYQRLRVPGYPWMPLELAKNGLALANKLIDEKASCVVLVRTEVSFTHVT